MANLKYFLWLTTRRGFQPGEVCALLNHFGSPERVYFADREEYALLGLPGGKRAALEEKDLTGAEKILADCDRLGIRIMTIQDADYPERLSQIDDPPAVLYWKGRPPAVDDILTIGVVGTRKCTPYGEILAGKLGLELARSGVTLVSGMAEGIDADSLRGALQGGGTVISVLAGGMDVIYPRQNARLYQDVAASGTLMSEYPPGTEHAGYHFPIRNRIISGLSMGVVVVEAGEPSGALITARQALEQNREVFAFPGAVNSPASLGCNHLIQRGEAKLVLSARDVLEEFAPLFPGRVKRLPAMEEEAARERLEVLKGQKSRVSEPAEKTAPSPVPAEKAAPAPAEPQRPVISLSASPEAFTDDERAILTAIEKRPLTADDITESAQIPARRVLSALTMLQLRELVSEKPGKRFCANVRLKE